MAMNDNATFLPGKGTAFVGTVGATPPVMANIDPLTTTTYTGFECIGHTSRENTVGLSKDGGDVSVIGSWWNEALRTRKEPVTWGLTLNSLQMDNLTLGLAFGGGTAAAGVYTVPDTVASVQKSLYVLMVDGTARMGLYFPKCDITMGDAPEVSTDSLFEIQLSATMLSTAGSLFKIYHPAITAP